MRQLTKYELKLISMIIDAEGASALDGIDLDKLLVKSIDKNVCLKFVNNESGCHIKFPAEALYVIDNTSLLSIHALLFTKNGSLDELEIYRDDGKFIEELPSIHKWEIVLLKPTKEGRAPNKT